MGITHNVVNALILNTVFGIQEYIKYMKTLFNDVKIHEGIVIRTMVEGV